MLEINEFKIEERKRNIPEEEEIDINEYQEMCVLLFFKREREREDGRR